MSAPAPASFNWLPAIPVATKPTQAHLDALCKRFSYTPPAALQNLFLSHSGEQIQPSLFWAQNVTNGKWKKESVGPIYPLGSTTLDESENEDADEYASYSVSVVNEMFEDELEDEDELPRDISSPANKGEKPKLPFFAFSEAKNSGHLLVIDTRTGNVLLLDVTHRSGPWIVAEDFDDFLKRLTESATGEKPGKDGEEEEEEEEEGDDAEMEGDDYDEEEEDVYCCDGCMDEITSTRYHCNQCKNYDLCAACKTKADGAASSSSTAKKGKKTAEADSHPASHTFTAIESKAGNDEEEEEEKSSAKPKKK